MSADKIKKDKVVIEDLRIDTIIGVNEWERSVKQTLLVTLDLGCDVKTAAANDQLSDTIDYTGIANRVIDFTSTHHFQLIETLAERLAQLLLAEYPVQSVKIYLRKPAAIAQAKSAGIQIERHREK
jgi:dihydroneopterin aldolase